MQNTTLKPGFLVGSEPQKTNFTRELVRLAPELRARALRLSGNPHTADDLVQDAMERALRFAPQYEEGSNLRAWVYQILFSVFVTRYRRIRRERTALGALARDPHAWTVPEHFAPPDIGVPLAGLTQKKLDALPEGFRNVLVMVDMNDLTYREAAKELGVPVGTVMSRLHRGRRILAGEMREAA